VNLTIIVVIFFIFKFSFLTIVVFVVIVIVIIYAGELGEDVSENKDEGIVRSQLKKGEGYLTPKEGATCQGIVDVWQNF